MIVTSTDNKLSTPSDATLLPPPYSRGNSASGSRQNVAYSSNNQLAPSSSTSYYSQSNHDYIHPQYTSSSDTPSSLPSTAWGQPHHSPPPAFMRQPSLAHTYPPFSPMFLIARSKYLNKGFPPLLPPSLSQPHPLSTHDIPLEEWLGFLEDLQHSATLTERENRWAHLPIVSLVPVVNTIVEYGIKSYLKGRKSEAVADVVEQWNHHYFHPRRVDVILMKGQQMLCGRKNISVSNLASPQATSPTDSLKDAGPSGTYEPLTQGQTIDEKDTTYRLFIVSL
ncbi:hypothetical protein BDQ12DRAFT_720509 [Crucibulum laeve]|uniref:Uncharacterized protein n=1 Tax=Crucibulum laeve TaxID=68775 RepID=A0A5C3MB37_9AGAR|nr:hypothetical protein BDQ12DRAFT_720509 [Crucibulum laeve]